MSKTMIICLAEDGHFDHEFMQDPVILPFFNKLKKDHEFVIQSFDRWQVHGSVPKTKNVVITENNLSNFHRNTEMYVSFAPIARVKQHTDLSYIIIGDAETCEMNISDCAWIIGKVATEREGQFDIEKYANNNNMIFKKSAVDDENYYYYFEKNKRITLD
nr:hypothetical protein K-LCC10_0089 [Kaumoebavirus]